MHSFSRWIVPATVVGAMLAHSYTSIAQTPARNMPPPEAQALWNHLQNYQREFGLFPGTDKLYKGSDPHGALLTTYVNSAAHQALTSAASGPLPNGSIIVKENYTSDKKLDAVTVMYKVAGYDPPNNDWFWLKRTADGKIEAAGKVGACMSCHKAAQRDYVLTPVRR